MQQLVFVEPGRLEWQDASDPEPGPGQAVVRPLAVPTTVVEWDRAAEHWLQPAMKLVVAR